MISPNDIIVPQETYIIFVPKVLTFQKIYAIIKVQNQSVLCFEKIN